MKTEKTKRSKRLVAQKSFVSISIETSGLSCEEDEIIRLTAVKFNEDNAKQNLDLKDKAHREFDVWVKPTKPISEQARNLIGIFEDIDDWFCDAPSITTALKDFDTFVGNLPIITYNAEFCMPFLQKAYLNILERQEINKVHCILSLVKKLASLNKDYKLKDYKIDTLINFYYGKEGSILRGCVNPECIPINDCYVYAGLYRFLTKAIAKPCGK